MMPLSSMDGAAAAAAAAAAVAQHTARSQAPSLLPQTNTAALSLPLPPARSVGRPPGRKKVRLSVASQSPLSPALTQLQRMDSDYKPHHRVAANAGSANASFSAPTTSLAQPGVAAPPPIRTAATPVNGVGTVVTTE